MSLRALAFGPLSSGQLNASARLSLPGGGSSSIGAGGGGDTGEGDGSGVSPGILTALTGRGAVGGGFSPLFPDQYTGSSSTPATGTSVSALTGMGPEDASAAATDTSANFLSDLSKTLSGLRATGVNVQDASTLPPGWAQDLDAAFKGLKAASSGAKTVLPSSKAPDLGMPSGATNLSGLDSSGFSLNAPEPTGFDTSGFSLSGQSPEFAGLQGFSVSDLGSEAGGAGAGGAGASGALGALTSLYGLAQGAATGNPIGVAQGALGAYGGLTSAAGVAPISSALVQVAPEIASAVVTGLTGTSTAGMSTTALTAALSNALAGASAASAPLIMALVSYLGAAEESHARHSGWWNNPIKGALYSNATAGVKGANDVLDQLAQTGGITKASTSDLEAAVTPLANLLLPYYGTGQGGARAIRASESAGSPGTQSKAEYTGNFDQAQQGLVDVVNELLKRGVSYEDLGKLPVSGDWTQQTLDLNDPLRTLYAGNAAKFDPEGSQILWRAALPGGAPPLNLTPSDLLTAALGSSGAAPDQVTHASGLETSMYGGPLWTALARMNAGGPGLQDLISQHFDPWATVRRFSPDQLYTALEPNVLRTKASQADTNAFTSGGM